MMKKVNSEYEFGFLTESKIRLQVAKPKAFRYSKRFKSVEFRHLLNPTYKSYKVPQPDGKKRRNE